MKLSARNQLAGKITEIEKGAVNAKVTVQLGEQTITSIITITAVEDLALEVGSHVKAIVKSSSTMLMVGDAKISARNQLTGKVTAIEKGAVNTQVTVDIDGQAVTSVVTISAVEDLNLTVGSDVKVIIKSSSVMLVA
ncbi:molybdopterin-binding protein [Bacillus sp. Bva_UNVM-123]|uniref:molybdopterin-binding protein n=1 Tax=Bacillus sp. Bva_UNVM-123 TaxID=2829798 RepID=UPI00391F5EA3